MCPFSLPPNSWGMKLVRCKTSLEAALAKDTFLFKIPLMGHQMSLTQVAQQSPELQVLWVTVSEEATLSISSCASASSLMSCASSLALHLTCHDIAQQPLLQ